MGGKRIKRLDGGESYIPKGSGRAKTARDMLGYVEEVHGTAAAKGFKALLRDLVASGEVKVKGARNGKRYYR